MTGNRITKRHISLSLARQAVMAITSSAVTRPKCGLTTSNSSTNKTMSHYKRKSGAALKAVPLLRLNCSYIVVTMYAVINC